MKVLFDQGTPVPLRRALTGHVVSTAYELGWATMTNGEFLDAAEAVGFEALVTTDGNLPYQQKIEGLRIGVLVLPTTDWTTIRRHTDRIASAVATLRPGDVLRVTFEGRS